jgi:uncharacterized membrane protein
MKNLKSNKLHLALLSAAGLFALASWGIAFYHWSILPGTIPTHFGFSGAPDAWANKSIFYVFFTPFLQTVMLGSFVFLYEKPQYSDMPTTLLLMSMDKKAREHAFGLIRIMLVGVSLWIGVLFSYLTYAMNASALSKILGPSPYIMGGLIIGMLSWLAWYTVKVYKYTKIFLKKK